MMSFVAPTNGNRIVPAAVALLVCACQACSQAPAVREEQVRFSNGNITLAGSLVLPAGRGRHPAVVFFHGSGPQTRDESMAYWFAQHGVAALAYDKRGTGESAGDFRQVAFMDLCDDGLAAIELLKARSDINPRKIGVFGISQGGWLGPLAASRSKDIAFVIAVSGPGVTPGEQMIYYYRRQLLAGGFSETDAADASSLRREVWHYLATGDGRQEAKAALDRSRSRPWYATLQSQNDSLFALSDAAILDDAAVRSRLWFKVEMNYDPTAALRKLSVPALFLFGDKDDLVPVDRSVAIIRQTLNDSGGRDFTIKVFPGADHGIYVAGPDTGRQPAPGDFDTINDWVRKKVE
jgi:pimeloyl-ACP methyl ester carboxylesterase